MEFINNTIGSAANMQIPNYTVNPRNPGSFIQSLGQFQMGNTPQSARSGMNGYQEHSRVVSRTNTFVQRQYAAMAWEDGSHRYISPGAPVFYCNYALEDTRGASCLATLATVNNALQFASQFHQEVLSEAEAGEPEHRIFENYMNRFGEQGLAEYIHALKTKTLDRLGEDMGELKKFHDLAMLPDFRFLTLAGIRAHISFLGAVLTVTPSTDTYQGMDRGKFETFTDVNVLVDMKGEIANVWGGLNHMALAPNTKLFLVVERNEKTRAFQIMPYHTRQSALSGKKRKNSIVWYVGTTLYYEPKIPSFEITLKAIKSQDPVVAYNQIEKLARITIAMRL